MMQSCNPLIDGDFATERNIFCPILELPPPNISPFYLTLFHHIPKVSVFSLSPSRPLFPLHFVPFA